MPNQTVALESMFCTLPCDGTSCTKARRSSAASGGMAFPQHFSLTTQPMPAGMQQYDYSAYAACITLPATVGEQCTYMQDSELISVCLQSGLRVFRHPDACQPQTEGQPS